MAVTLYAAQIDAVNAQAKPRQADRAHMLSSDLLPAGGFSL